MSEQRADSESYFWPTVWAVGLHIVILAALLVSWSMTPELPPAKPIVQATLYQLQSQSQATVQTNQKIAGEAAKTSAPQYETEQIEQRRQEQERQRQQAVARAEEQKKAAEQARQKAEEERQAAASKAEAEKKQQEQAQKQAEAKKQEEQKRIAEIARKKAEEDAKRKAQEDAKKKAAEDAKKKAAEAEKKKAADEAAKKKAAEDAKKKAEAEAAKKKAADEAKKKAAADAEKKKAADAARKAAEDKKAAALAELLSEDTQRQQALADTHGNQTAGNFDDLIRLRVAERWSRPPSARVGMRVEVQIAMLPDGTITSAGVTRSSGDTAFDNSAVAAIRNVGRIPEMQGLKANEFQPYRSFKMTFTPEDLAL